MDKTQGVVMAHSRPHFQGSYNSFPLQMLATQHLELKVQ